MTREPKTIAQRVCEIELLFQQAGCAGERQMGLKSIIYDTWVEALLEGMYVGKGERWT